MLSLDSKNMETMMFKLIRWFYSTSLHHCPTLKPHSDWTWQPSLFLCISNTARRFVSFSIWYALLAWMVHEQYCQSLEYNEKSSTNRRKCLNLSIHSFRSHCLLLSLNLFVNAFLCPTSFSPPFSFSAVLFRCYVNVKLFFRKQIKGCRAGVSLD